MVSYKCDDKICMVALKKLAVAYHCDGLIIWKKPFLGPVYNDPPVAPFLHTLKWFSSSLFSKAEMISGENKSNLTWIQKKLSGKMQQNFN